MTDNSLKGKTSQGLLWGGLSNSIQQLLQLVFGIFLARLLTPGDYGMVGMLIIFSNIASSIKESGFTAALTNKKDASHRDFNAVFWCSTLLGIILYIILFFGAPLIARFYNQPQLTPLARLLFLGFLISSTSTAHYAYLFKHMMVRETALAQTIAIVVSGVAGVTMAFCGMAYWGIAIQNLTYIITFTLLAWYFSPWRPTLNIDLAPIRPMLNFSIKLLITNIFRHINENIFSVLLGKLFKVSDVGFYSQANKWSTMGQSLISGMIRGVAQPVLSEVNNDRERLQRVFRKMLCFTAFISFPVMLGLALISEQLITIAVTDKWIDCVPIMQLLCIWGAFLPILSLYQQMIISQGKSDVIMWHSIITGVLQIVLLLLTAPYGIHTMVSAYVVFNIIYMLVWQHYIRQYTGVGYIDALKEIVPFALMASATMIATHYITIYIDNIYLLFTAKIVVAVVIYIVLMSITNVSIYKESITFVKQKLTQKK